MLILAADSRINLTNRLPQKLPDQTGGIILYIRFVWFSKLFFLFPPPSSILFPAGENLASCYQADDGKIQSDNLSLYLGKLLWDGRLGSFVLTVWAFRFTFSHRANGVFINLCKLCSRIAFKHSFCVNLPLWEESSLQRKNLLEMNFLRFIWPLR